MRTRHFLYLAAGLLCMAALVALASEGSQAAFDFLKSHQALLADYTDRHPWQAAGIYVALFVLATGLSIPVATVFTLVAGAVFDFTEALLLTVLAGSIGATLAMLLSRHVFRDTVARRWPRQVAVLDRGIERDGGLYLLSLRLAPVPPFFVVNAVMGLTRMPARQFFLITLLGMAPLDAVFVNAGHALARIDAPEEAASPRVLLSLALVGLMPLLLRRVARRWRQPRHNGDST